MIVSLLPARRRAVHEAGHVITCLLFGYTVAEASIVTNPRSPHQQGYTKSNRPTPEQLFAMFGEHNTPIKEKQMVTKQQALISLAGAAAESLILGTSGFCLDERQAEDYLRSATMRKHLRADRATRAKAGPNAEAMELLRLHKVLIEEIAQALEVAAGHGRCLGQEQLYEILKRRPLQVEG